MDVTSLVEVLVKDYPGFTNLEEFGTYDDFLQTATSIVEYVSEPQGGLREREMVVDFSEFCSKDATLSIAEIVIYTVATIPTGYIDLKNRSALEEVHSSDMFMYVYTVAKKVNEQLGSNAVIYEKMDDLLTASSILEFAYSVTKKSFMLQKSFPASIFFITESRNDLKAKRDQKSKTTMINLFDEINEIYTSMKLTDNEKKGIKGVAITPKTIDKPLERNELSYAAVYLCCHALSSTIALTFYHFSRPVSASQIFFGLVLISGGLSWTSKKNENYLLFFLNFVFMCLYGDLFHALASFSYSYTPLSQKEVVFSENVVDLQKLCFSPIVSVLTLVEKNVIEYFSRNKKDADYEDAQIDIKNRQLGLFCAAFRQLYTFALAFNSFASKRFLKSVTGSLFEELDTLNVLDAMLAVLYPEDLGARKMYREIYINSKKIAAYTGNNPRLKSTRLEAKANNIVTQCEAEDLLELIEGRDGLNRYVNSAEIVNFCMLIGWVLFVDFVDSTGLLIRENLKPLQNNTGDELFNSLVNHLSKNLFIGVPLNIVEVKELREKALEYAMLRFSKDYNNDDERRENLKDFHKRLKELTHDDETEIKRIKDLFWFIPNEDGNYNFSEIESAKEILLSGFSKKDVGAYLNNELSTEQFKFRVFGQATLAESLRILLFRVPFSLAGQFFYNLRPDLTDKINYEIRNYTLDVKFPLSLRLEYLYVFCVWFGFLLLVIFPGINPLRTSLVKKLGKNKTFFGLLNNLKSNPVALTKVLFMLVNGGSTLMFDFMKMKNGGPYFNYLTRAARGIKNGRTFLLHFESWEIWADPKLQNGLAFIHALNLERMLAEIEELEEDGIDVVQPLTEDYEKLQSLLLLD
jgi:hypothetical protein